MTDFELANQEGRLLSKEGATYVAEHLGYEDLTKPMLGCPKYILKPHVGGVYELVNDHDSNPTPWYALRYVVGEMRSRETMHVRQLETARFWSDFFRRAHETELAKTWWQKLWTQIRWGNRP